MTDELPDARPVRAPRPHRQIAFRTGISAESRAAAFLIAKGFRILARRWRSPVGEIDIIARRRSLLIFVEVKARAQRGRCRLVGDRATARPYRCGRRGLARAKCRRPHPRYPARCHAGVAGTDSPAYPGRLRRDRVSHPPDAARWQQCRDQRGACWQSIAGKSLLSRSRGRRSVQLIYLSNSQRYAARGLLISGRRASPFPFSSSLAREGDGAPGGAGRVGLERALADPAEVRPAPLRRRLAPSDVGGRRLPALQPQLFGGTTFFPCPAASLPIRARPSCDPRRTASLFMICSFHEPVNRNFQDHEKSPSPRPGPE